MITSLLYDTGTLTIKSCSSIKNENGVLLAKAGCFLNVRKEDVTTMTAWYRKPDKKADETETPPEQMTALIRHYRGELQEYKERYEK